MKRLIFASILTAAAVMAQSSGTAAPSKNAPAAPATKATHAKKHRHHRKSATKSAAPAVTPSAATPVKK